MRTSIFIKQKMNTMKSFLFIFVIITIFTIFAYQQEESLDDMNKESVVRMA